MDRMLYVAMSGAKQAMEQHASVANNIANVSTTGFRAQINAFQAVPVIGEEAATRAFVISTTPGADFRPGPSSETGRDLDVAIKGDGWLVVQTEAGEAYTRAGNLQVAPDGQVTGAAGLPVLGDGGPLVIPPRANWCAAPTACSAWPTACRRPTPMPPSRSRAASSRAATSMPWTPWST